MIGIIGLTTDMFLAWLGTALFPWKRKGRGRKTRSIPISMVAVQNRGDENPADAEPSSASDAKPVEALELVPPMPPSATTKPAQL